MITPQSANWTAMATMQEGRRHQVQVLIENVPDVICTETPPDAWSKTYAVDSATAGSTPRVDCGTNTALTQLPDWSLCGWFKVDTLPGSFTQLAGAFDFVTNAKGYGVCVFSTGEVTVVFSQGGGSVTHVNIGTITTGAWFYVAVSVGGLNSTVIHALVNTTIFGPAYRAFSYGTRNSWTASIPFRILARADNTTGSLDGKCGYLAVFNRALTIEEMRAIKYRRLTPAWGNDDSAGLWDRLVAQYVVERGSGSTLVNHRSPGTHDGTLTGVTWVSDACYTVTYRPVLAGSLTTGQAIEPLSTRTSVQSTSLRVADTDAWLTALIASGVSPLRKRARILLGFDGLTEAEYQPVFNGRVADLSYASSVYTIDIADAIFDVKSRIRLGRGSLGSGITNASTTAIVQVNRFFANATDYESIWSGYVRMDDEIIGVGDLAGSSSTQQTLGTGSSALVRGALGSTAASHNSGVVIQELLALLGQQPAFVTLVLLLSHGGYYSTSDYDLALESSYTDATNRTRRGRGAGMSPSDVAIAEIAALNTFDTIDVYAESDIEDVKDFIEREILRGAGMYFAVKPDGRLTVRTLAVPTAGSVVYSLTPDRIHGRPRWRIAQGDVVNYVSIEYGYSPLTQDTTGTYINSDATSGTTFGIRSRNYTLPATSASTDLGTVTGQILQRYKDPPVTIDVECGLFESLLEIGDAIHLTDWHLPDVEVGQRGVTNLLCEVIGRTFDPVRGRTRLTLLDVSRM